MSGQNDTVKCGVCNHENPVFRFKCSNCGVRLSKKKHKKMASKKKKALQKNKRKPLGCDGNKIKYRRRSDASKARKNIYSQKGAILRIYKCKICNAYHLTKLRSKK